MNITGAMPRVVSSNTIEQSEGKRPRRGPKARADDPVLVAAIRRAAEAQPTYGYTRIAAILNRELQADGLAPVSVKRVYRVMKKHGLVLKRNSDHTVTRSQLAEAVCRDVRVSSGEAAQLIDEMIAKMSDTLENGETVKIPRFGSFSVHQKGPRPGRDLIAGREVSISPRRVVLFHPSLMLRQKLQ